MALQDPAATLGTLGNYDLIEKLGEGSMGTVYKARHWTTREVVAIKVMPSTIARKPMLLKRFEQEFRIASRVEHRNVVRVLEYSGRGPEPYLVMEFVDGAALGDRLERTGRLSEAEAVRIITQVAEGLHHAHELGLLHRDVKPDNVLVTADGIAKLTDLGLAKEMDAALELTRTGTGLGTPNFMAPEQFRNAKHADVRCDMYSLAATLYQMVTGELPFGQGDPVRILMAKMSNALTPPRHLVPELSERTERAILRALDPEPERRTASCREFVDELLGRTAPRPAARARVHSSEDQTEEELRKTQRVRFRHGDDAAEEDLAKTHPMRRSGPEALAGRQATNTRARSEIEARLARSVGASTPPPTPTPTAPAPAQSPKFALSLNSQRYMPPPRSPAPQISAPRAASAQGASGDGVKTLLIVLITGVVTIVLSHLLFAFWK
jgi:serine/threonine protein kinase